MGTDHRRDPRSGGGFHGVLISQKGAFSLWTTYFKQYLQKKFPFLEGKPWNYKDDLCVVGAWDLYDATGDKSWTEPVETAEKSV